MTTLDWLIVAATAMFAISGYFRGLIVGALSLGGFIGGAIAGSRIADALLAGGASSPYAPLCGLIGALVAGGLLAVGLEGIGVRLRRGLRLPFLGLLDRVAGAALSGAVALALAWVLGVVVVALPGPGSLASEIRRSSILRRLDELLPPSGVVLHALARIDPLPAIAGAAGSVAAPPTLATATPAVARAERSVVRVVGTACGLGHRGLGLGDRPRRGGDQRARGRRRERHDDRRGRRPPGVVAGARRAVRPPQRPRDPRRAAGSMRPSSSCWRNRRRRAPER